MMCDNSEITGCDDCDCKEKCCLECGNNSKCEKVCRVQSCKKYWDSKSTDELIEEISSDESTVLHVAVADRMEELQARVKQLESAITTAMLDDEGFIGCDYVYCQDDCNNCRYKNLRDIADEITKREAKSDDK